MSADQTARARFVVRGQVKLSGNRKTVLYGDIAEGEISKGMTLRVVQPDRNLDLEILSVEFVDGTPSGSYVGLIVEQPDKSLDHTVEAGTILSVAESPGPY